jgi:hypothetical protein
MSRLGAFPRRPERGLALVGLAALVYLGCFEVLHHGFYSSYVIADTPLYQTYGEAMRAGRIPYRDFALEYPPGALPVFLAPVYLSRNYFDAFFWLMGGFGVCALALVALSRPPRLALPFIALSPLAIGSYLPTRFDLWPTALVVAAVAAFLRDRHRLGWVALGAAVGVKLFPVVLVPLALIWTFRRRGAAELGRGLALFGTVLAAVFGPFLVLAPHGLFHSLWGQFSRPLQIETLAASFLMTFGHPAVIVSHGSFNIKGHGAIGASSAIVSALAIAAVWIGFARGPIERDRFVRSVAACLCAFIAFGKVLSPQFLIWLVPIVPLVRGRRGLAADALLLAALLDTAYWFPRHYFPYVYDARLAWLVFVRDLLLVALFFVLSLPSHGLPGTRWRAHPARTRPALPRFGRLHRQPRAGPGIP